MRIFTRLRLGLLAAVLTLPRLGAAQYVWQDTRMSCYATSALDAVSPSVAWVAGRTISYTACQEFSRTTDGGEHWQPGLIQPATGLAINDLSATDDQHAWVAMSHPTTNAGAVYATADGGQTWTLQASAVLPAATGGGAAMGISFRSAQNGAVVGNPVNGRFVAQYTSNGGQTWTAAPAASMPASLSGETLLRNSLERVNDRLWMATSLGRVLRSTDGGASWAVSSIFTNTSAMQWGGSMAFSDEQNGVYIRFDGSFTRWFRTTNAGQTWVAVTPGIIGAVNADVAAVPGLPGTYVNVNGSGSSSNGQLVQSSNYGQSWSRIPVSGPYFQLADFVSSEAGWFTNTSSTDVFRTKYYSYCRPTNSGGCSISLLQLLHNELGTSFIGASGCSTLSSYTIMTGGSPPSRDQGTVWPGQRLRLLIRSSVANAAGLWVDWNQNKQYEAGEYVPAPRPLAANVTDTITFTVPASARLGHTMMRVRTAAASLVTDPCQTSFNGEMREVSLRVQAPPATVPPTWTSALKVGQALSPTLGGLATDRQGNTFMVGSAAYKLNLPPRDSITLSYASEAFLVKRSASGAVVWARQLGLGNSRFSAVTTDSLGNAYVTGFFLGSITTATGPVRSNGQDAVLIKYDAQGVLQWASRAGASGSDQGLGVVVARNGRIYVSGYTNGGSPFTVGSTVTLPALPASSTTPFLLCYDASGTALWAARPTISGFSRGQAVAINPAGTRIILSGDMVGSATFDTISVASSTQTRPFVACYSPQGRARWVQVGTSSNTYTVATAAGVAATADRVYAGGTLGGDGTFGSVTVPQPRNASGSHGFLASFDLLTGDVQWLRVPDGSYTYVTKVALDQYGRLYAGGVFDTYLSWGPALTDQLFSIGSTDAWVGQFDAATGASRWLKQGGSQLACLLTGMSVSPTGDLAALGTYQLGAIFDTRPAMSVVSGYTGIWLAQIPSTCRLGAPTATGPAAPLCVGESFTLTATNLPAGATATWSGPNGFSSTQPTVTVPASSVAAGGIYTLSASAGAQGCAATSRVLVQVNALPATPTVTQQPQSGGVLLTSSAASGNQWYQDGQPIPGATSPTLLATTAAQYTVRVTGPEGCESAPSAPVGVVLAARGATSLALELSPNPTNGLLTLRLPASPGPVQLLLCDAAGRTRWQATLPAGTHRLDLRTLPAGVYVLRAAGPTGTAVRRVVRL